MNLKERNMLYRVWKAFNEVPGAYIGGGSKTTTVAGAVSFGNDLQNVRQHCGDAMMAMYDGALSAEERDVQFNTAMAAAERYIDMRRRAGWSARSNAPRGGVGSQREGEPRIDADLERAPATSSPTRRESRNDDESGG